MCKYLDNREEDRSEETINTGLEYSIIIKILGSVTRITKENIEKAIHK